MGAIFASRPSVALVIFFGLESYIGKTHFLFLPYKACANGVRVPLVNQASFENIVTISIRTNIVKILVGKKVVLLVSLN